MPSQVEIRMTQRGYEVAIGTRIVQVASIAAALAFASDHLERARELRDLSTRCE